MPELKTFIEWIKYLHRRRMHSLPMKRTKEMMDGLPNNNGHYCIHVNGRQWGKTAGMRNRPWK